MISAARTGSRVTLASAAALLVGVAGCSKEPATTVSAPPSPSAAPPAPPVAGIPSEWLGRWTGPEGTYLEIVDRDGRYEVTVSDLDGPKAFPATAQEGGLAFERNGVRETLRPTDGAGTGMKWLDGKKNCLTVKQGEGFCRD